MATPLLYTTVEAVRACLGLDGSDLPDTILTTQTMKTQFTVDLDGWYPSGAYVTDWSAGNYDPTDESDNDIVATSAAQRKAHLLSLYSMWFAAHRAVQTLLVIPQSVSDGKNEMRRFDKIKLESMLERVAGNLDQFRSIILEEQSNVSTGVLGMVKSESDLYDPVTGA